MWFPFSCQRKHEVDRKSRNVALALFVESLGRPAVEGRQVAIKQNILISEHQAISSAPGAALTSSSMSSSSLSSNAGGRVGYESTSQFSREYSRLFGAPPQRDIRRMGLITSSPHSEAILIVRWGAAFLSAT